MKLLGKLKIKLIKHKLGLFVCIIFVLAMLVGWLVYSLPIADTKNDLLSTISQGLAAILALVFAIAIFGSQMMQRFTAMDKIIDGKTKGLMILFAVGILLPLIQLETDYDFLNNILHLNFDKTANLSLAIDLFLATFCVLAVIPFLIKVNRTMKYDGGIPKLAEEVAEAIDSLRPESALNRISELIKLGINTVDDILEPKTREIVNELKHIGEKVVDKEWGEAYLKTIKGLGEIGLEATTKEKELGASVSDIIYVLEEIGLKCAEKGLDGVPLPGELGTPRIPSLNILANEQFYKSTKIQVVPRKFDHLFHETTHRMGRIYSPIQEALTALGWIGIEAINKNLHKYPIKISGVPSSKELKKIAMNAINNNLSDSTVVLASFYLFILGVKVRNERSLFARQLPHIYYIMDDLLDIADNAYEKDRIKFKNTYEASLVYIWVLGAFVNKCQDKYAKDIALHLKKSNKQIIRNLLGNEEIRIKSTKFLEECKEFLIKSREDSGSMINRYPKLIDELKVFDNPVLIDELKAFEETLGACSTLSAKLV